MKIKKRDLEQLAALRDLSNQVAVIQNDARKCEIF